MSFARVRPKIPVNIPAKRRSAANPVHLTQEPESKSTTASVLAGIANNATITNSEQTLFDSTNDLSNSQESAANTPTSNESKQFFKRIKPPVQVPAKTSRSRPAFLETETNKPLCSELASRPEEILIKAEEPSCGFSTSDFQAMPERLATPPPVPAVLPLVVSSPAKSPARPQFVRPIAKDYLPRRHSVHVSSASESEDETQRNGASRMRKISEGSAFIRSMQDEQAVDDPGDINECVRLSLLPQKRKAKASNHVRKIAEARRNFNRRFSREKPDRSNLKMFDLLFYNPNTISENTVPTAQSEIETETISHEPDICEEVADDPATKTDHDPAEVAMPVPQVKIGANGEIILDEKSLVIETTYSRKRREALRNAAPICEDRSKRSSYYGKKHSRPKEWSPFDLKCFYKALNSIGTDFALMESLFPGRSRGDLKNKFKREEKVNRALIDKALSQPMPFNITVLKEEFERERALVEKETQKRLEEMQRLAQEKKDNMANEFRAVDNLVMRQRVLSGEFREQTRRSKRKVSGRKLSSDFVDPFDSDETDVVASSCETKKTKRGSESSVREAIGHSVVAEEINQQEFFKLFESNMGKMKPTTITVAPPSRQSTQVRLILDVAELDNEEPDVSNDGLESVFVLQEENNSSNQVLDCFNLNQPGDSFKVENYYRNAGGMSYIVMKSEKGSIESQLSQMHELKQGLLIAMLSDSENDPSIRRCSLFMIVNKQTEHGGQASVMPVVLPPEIMKLILNDISQS